MIVMLPGYFGMFATIFEAASDASTSSSIDGAGVVGESVGIDPGTDPSSFHRPRSGSGSGSARTVDRPIPGFCRLRSDHRRPL